MRRGDVCARTLFVLAALVSLPLAGCSDKFDAAGTSANKVTLSGFVSESLAKPALKPTGGTGLMHSPMAGGEVKVIDSTGAVVGTSAIASDGTYSASVDKGDNYVVRATKGNVCLKSFVLKADASKMVMVDPNSSAVVKTLAAKLGAAKLGEPGEDVSALIAAQDVPSLLVAVNASGQLTVVAQAIESDIAAGADYTSTAASVSAGAASTAGDTGANAIAASIIAADTVTAQSGASSAPAGVTASPGDGWVTVRWEAVTGAASYNLYYSTSPGMAGVKDGNHSGTSATIAGLTNGITYYFTVTALNAVGESAGSAQASALPRLGTWAVKTQMPTRLYGHSAAAVNGIIYVIGGVWAEYNAMGVYLGGGWTGMVEAYDPATDTWSVKAPMPTVRRNFAAVTVNGIIYAIGGEKAGADAVPTVEAYDPATDMWATKVPMPTARSALSATVVNGIIYVIGGEEIRVLVGNTLTNRRLSTVEAYDPATNTWTTKTSMPTARAYFSAHAVNGIIYAIAGYDGVMMAKVEAYDPATDTWTTKASMPTARDYFAAAEVNGTIFIISGNSDNGSPQANVDAYAPSTNTWASKPAIPTPRYGADAAVVNGTVYVFGGYPPGSGPLTPIVEEYQ